jgi:type IV pilus assembly protein PilM
MASQKYNGLVGVSFTNSQIQLVEIESIGGQYQINKIIQKDANLSFDFPMTFEKSSALTTQIANAIDEIVETHQITIGRAAFALDSQKVLIKKVPVDSDLSGEEIKNQVNWEAEQFVFHSLDRYVVDFNQLAGDRSRGINELLIIMARKDIINFLLEVFNKTRLKLQVIDVDIFAAIRAVKANFDYAETEKIGLIDLNPKSAKITLVTRGEYFLSTEATYESNGLEESKLVNLDDDQLTKLISKELRRIILDHKLGRNVEDLDQLFFYGDMLKPQVVENFQHSYDVRITKVNPFRKVRFNARDVGEDLIRNHPEKFVNCVGVALRNIS